MRTTTANDLLLEWSDGNAAPSQRRGQASAEERLLSAVLEDAVRTWRHCRAAERGRAARLRRELAAWFTSDEDVWPCSFARVCEHFGLERGAVRESLGLGATPDSA